LIRARIASSNCNAGVGLRLAVTPIDFSESAIRMAMSLLYGKALLYQKSNEKLGFPASASRLFAFARSRANFA
jgi:hypothetical protein